MKQTTSSLPPFILRFVLQDLPSLKPIFSFNWGRDSILYQTIPCVVGEKIIKVLFVFQLTDTELGSGLQQ